MAGSNNGITFRYPAAWRYYPYGVGGSMVTITGYLSTDFLHEPCTTTQVPTGERYTCTTPLNHLQPDGVLVTLGGPDGPVPPASPLPVNGTVAGLPAAITSGPATPDCTAVGGTTEIQVLGHGGQAENFRSVQFDGCFADPTATTIAEFKAFTASVQIA